MTIRSLAQSPVPAEDWVDLVFRAAGASKDSEVRLCWMVTDESDGLLPDKDEDGRPEGRRVGLSQRTESNRKTKVSLFAQPSTHQVPPPGELVFEQVDTKVFEDEVKASIVRDGTDSYGYLRIFTFHTRAFPDVPKFLAAIRELLTKLPATGLIIDVRANGGGYIHAAEGMLQYLTDKPIQPEPMQFISSEDTYELSGRLPELNPWRQSLGEAAETGEQYSVALPLDPATEVNDEGQVYHGPVLLVTDALSYSATDIFAAGFQDNGIGLVLGVDDYTGAGGANRWTLDDLARVWPGGPFEVLPKESRMCVALRRSLRVGAQTGRPVEDLGVRPDVRYRMTRKDLLWQNRGLIERAIQVLREGRRFTALAPPAGPATAQGCRRET
jgi:C-terminal processing protease CtpA/Prc